jgi:glycosyltransferase involved in cell wall biosynthesis
VARGKGFTGLIRVLPLGFDERLFRPGSQSLHDDELVLGLFGRLVPEKGLLAAVKVLQSVHAIRPARLVVRGAGPDIAAARALAESLGLASRIDLGGWLAAPELAETYRQTHVVLVPSHATATWVEQYGRVIVEAQASGAIVAGYASGTIPEVGGDAALLAQPGDVRALQSCIATLAADPADWSARRAIGIAASSERTWSRVAALHAALYRDVACGTFAELMPPRSPTVRRARARAEFGPTAATPAGLRPFAIPYLRRGGRVAAFLARATDAFTEAKAKIRTT